MKRILWLLGILFITVPGKTQNITAAEYFVDTDPGAGNGVPITVTAGTNIVFNVSVPTTSLSQGFHFLAIRAKGADDKWGLFETRGFYISTAATVAANIIAAEYFVDTDPGTGNGLPLTVTPGSTVPFTALVPTASLSNGFHFLGIRTKDADGHWGLFETRGFYISPAATAAADISAAEFFVDNDPGPGNGTAIPVSAGTTVPFIATIPVSSLTPGFHFLSIRTRDTNGKWGLFENRGFYISTATSDMPFTSAAEYFYDNDPGPGNGQPLTITTPGNTVNQNFSIPVPLSMSQGPHFLAIRTRDLAGNWSLYEYETLIVSGSLPLSFLSFTAKLTNDRVLLKWRTENEVNTLKFDVERSKNGLLYEKIGEVAANNTSGINDYQFTDMQPGKGISYYRLRQVDIDGHFEYSRIARIYMDGKLLVVITPNPAGNHISIDGADQFQRLKITDMSGKTVKQVNKPGTSQQIDVSDLPAGMYLVYLIGDNGIITEKFIKQ
jgi:hypothetical protein